MKHNPFYSDKFSYIDMVIEGNNSDILSLFNIVRNNCNYYGSAYIEDVILDHGFILCSENRELDKRHFRGFVDGYAHYEDKLYLSIRIADSDASVFRYFLKYCYSSFTIYYASYNPDRQRRYCTNDKEGVYFSNSNNYDDALDYVSFKRDTNDPNVLVRIEKDGDNLQYIKDHCSSIMMKYCAA